MMKAKKKIRTNESQRKEEKKLSRIKLLPNKVPFPISFWLTIIVISYVVTYTIFIFIIEHIHNVWLASYHFPVSVVLTLLSSLSLLSLSLEIFLFLYTHGCIRMRCSHVCCSCLLYICVLINLLAGHFKSFGCQVRFRFV